MIPVNEPFIGTDELANVIECVRTGWISSSGKFIDEFETRWAAYCGRRYGVAVCNGTAALQLGVACLGLKPGDEIILPSLTIISCAIAVVKNDAVPVLVDSDSRTWCMDVDQIEQRITPRTRAIMPVHIYGHPVDMDAVLNLAAKHNLAIIEDAAEVHGAEYLTRRPVSDHPVWRRCGSFGTVSCFSFYANKLITTGEGGMILTDDAVVAEKLRSLRNLCFQAERRFLHEELGFNFRFTNMQAALGLAQLNRIDQIVARKRWIAQEYTKRLHDINCLQIAQEKPWARSVYWMYGVVIAESRMRGVDFAQRLAEVGVETRPFFLGMHEQPCFKKRGLFANECYPIAEHLARQGVYLPSGLALTLEQLSQVCDAVHRVLS